MRSMNDEPRGIRLVAISGSVRSGNMTAKALALVLEEVRKHDGVGIEWIDPATLNLSFPGAGKNPAAREALQEKVAAATGVILATPEYHGSFSSVMKLVIENLGFPSVLSGKPVALLGVAAGSIGAIKALEHLRSVCSHIGAVVLPSAVSVANVNRVFDDAGRCLDPVAEKRIRGVATNLIDYIRNNICPRITLEQMVRSGES